MRVAQVGPSMAKIVPSLTVGTKLGEIFSVVQPADLDLKSFRKVRLASEGSVVSMLHMPPIDGNGQAKDPIQMKGQFLFSRGKKLLYFLGSPEISSIDAATRMGLTLADFAVHDPQKDLLFMSDAKDMLPLDEGKRKRMNSKKPLKKKETLPKPLPSFTHSQSVSSIPTATSSPVLSHPMSSRPSLKLSLQDVQFSADTFTPASGVENNIGIEALLRYIFSTRLGIDVNIHENAVADCYQVLKSNLILSLNHLLKLPSPSFLERLKLPLLVETELHRAMQNPDGFIQALESSVPSTARSTLRVSRLVKKESRASMPMSTSLDDSDSPRQRSWTLAPNDRSALLGLTDDMRTALKASWAEISQPKGSTGSQLNVFFDNLSKNLAAVDPFAASVFEGQSLQNQSDSLMGLMGFLTRTIDDPIKAMSTLRQPAVRFMILGFDRPKFQSLATSIASAVDKTLGRVNPNLSETWFTFAKSVFELFLGEYENLRVGTASKLFKSGGQKWKPTYTLLTHDRLIFYRDTAMTDKKDDLPLSSLEAVDRYETEVAGQPTPFVFYVENASGAKTFLAADSEASLNQWLLDLSRRIRAWSFVTTRKQK